VIITFISDEGLPTGFVEVDSTKVEEYSRDAQITSDPIEYGSMVSDHRIVAPPQVRITGVHTNYPALLGAGLRVEPVRAEKLHERLVEAFEDGTILDIFGSLEVLENYVMTSYSAVRDPANANVLRFTMTAQKLETVSSQLIGDFPVPTLERGWPPVWVGQLAVRRAEQAVSLAAAAAIGAFGALE